ncbi:hypothetical protein [Hephaestia mangrovi]|uniref:hypothetical protein n=1 Tax=Hephaestia mangrovi TaxID=2873268 RepID=UPI001CA70E30|nr:hypothetical protein [Hephaestia mangrovi]MBY8829898.1 hypothetical protein [Hephaestia mangrovi]
MKLRFVLSGSLIATTEADIVPPVGSEVVIRTISYKKGVTPGSLLSFKISEEWPPVYDFSTNPVEVSIDVNGYEVLEQGPPVE